MRNPLAEIVAYHPTWDWALEHALWLHQNEGWKPVITRSDSGTGWYICKPVYTRKDA